MNIQKLYYPQDSDSQADNLLLPGTQYPAGGLHTSVDTAWRMTQTPGLVGILSHLTKCKAYHGLSGMLITGCSDFLSPRHELFPVCTLWCTQGNLLWEHLLCQPHHRAWCCRV